MIFTWVIQRIPASTHLPNQTPMAAMMKVLTVAPTAARSPKARAIGVPQRSATIMSRRRWSVPASPCTCP